MEIKCCNCGYEFKDAYRTEDNKQVGDERFIRIDCFDKPFETDHEDKDNYYYNRYADRYDKAYLYACPKCRNIMLGEWE